MKKRTRLVLTLGVEQQVLIGEDIIVKIVRFRGNFCRVVFELPAEISVKRETINLDKNKLSFPFKQKKEKNHVTCIKI